MLLIIPLIVGAIVGPLMAIIFKRPQFVPHNLVLGILGALVFRLIAYAVLQTKNSAAGGFSTLGVFASIVGTLIFTYIPKLFSPVTAKKKK